MTVQLGLTNVEYFFKVILKVMNIFYFSKNLFNNISYCFIFRKHQSLFKLLFLSLLKVIKKSKNHILTIKLWFKLDSNHPRGIFYAKLNKFKDIIIPHIHSCLIYPSIIHYYSFLSVFLNSFYLILCSKDSITF